MRIRYPRSISFLFGEKNRKGIFSGCLRYAIIWVKGRMFFSKEGAGFEKTFDNNGYRRREKEIKDGKYVDLCDK